VIDSARKLAVFLPELQAADWVALDTEADSLHAYPEKLCLLQISIPGHEVLLDPLAGLELSPVLEALGRREIILHGSDYDLRLLWKTFRFSPQAVFDTMVAARLLGCREFGLNSLLSRFLGVSLEKGSQKANWARRPLTPKMEAYALNDVRHLRPLAERLRVQLQQKSRLEWHQQSCAQLISEASHIEKPDANLEWRVKGSHGLPPRALAVLREIWRWREQEALAANKPPYFVLAPALMIHFAAAAAEGRDVSASVPRHFSDRRRHGLCKAVAAGLETNHLPQPVRSKGGRQTDAERRRFHELEKRRNYCAHELELDPTIIASRSTLLGLAKDREKNSAELLPWQRQLLGI
jgi:ribonuclease D